MTDDQARATVGRLLMQARDDAFRSFEAAVRGQLQSPRARRIAAAANGGTEELTSAGWAAIDDTLVALLTAIEASDVVELRVGGISLVDASDGLPGELFGDTGWIQTFSVFESTV